MSAVTAKERQIAPHPTALAPSLVASAVWAVSAAIAIAILAAIIYSLVWESVLGRFIPGLRYLSIRHVVTSIYTSTLDSLGPSGRPDFGLGIDKAFSVQGALTGATVVCAIAILLSTWRLRKINID